MSWFNSARSSVEQERRVTRECDALIRISGGVTRDVNLNTTRYVTPWIATLVQTSESAAAVMTSFSKEILEFILIPSEYLI